MAGGALGVLVASWGVDALVGFLPGFGASTDLQIRPDRNVLLFTLAATMLTGLGIGLAPAWLARRVDIRDMLSAGGRTVAARRRSVQSAHRGAGRPVDGAGRGGHALRGHA